MKLNRTKIQLLLAAQGIKQSDLAVKSGISRQSISTILTRGTCVAVTAGKLAKALGVPVEEIVKEES